MPYGKTCTKCGESHCDCCQDCMDLGTLCPGCWLDTLTDDLTYPAAEEPDPEA